MKLILSSCDFGNKESQKVILDNLPCDINQCRLLFIPNEKATAEVIEGGIYHTRMQNLGFSKENIYVFDHNCPDEFRGLNIDAIFISGGNTFGTLQKIRECGFDVDIINYVKAGIVYIGGSAGAHIATKNIEHVTKYDENNVGMTNFDGLGLFDGVLVCHYTYLRKYDYDDLCNTSEYEAYFLTDSDSIVFEN